MLDKDLSSKDEIAEFEWYNAQKQANGANFGVKRGPWMIYAGKRKGGKNETERSKKSDIQSILSSYSSPSLSLSLPVLTSHHHAIRDVINYQVDILSLPNISSDCYSSAFDSLELLSSRNETVFPADLGYSTVEQELIWGWVADVFECFFSFRCFQVVYQRQTQGELSKGSSTSPTVNSNKVLRTRGESKLLCECMY